MKHHDTLRTPRRAAATSARKLLTPLLVAVLVLAARPVGMARAGTAGSDQTTGASVTYPAGWNLVSFPLGTDLSQAPGPLYTYVGSLQLGIFQQPGTLCDVISVQTANSGDSLDQHLPVSIQRLARSLS